MYLLEFAGVEDALAAREAASTCAGVEPLAPGLATAHDVSRIGDLAMTRTAAELVGTADGGLAAARELLQRADLGDRVGSVRVRARDVRGTTSVSTSEAERVLGSVLVERGFSVDLDHPDHELRVLFCGTETELTHVTEDEDALRAAGSEAVAALGWTVARSRRDFGDRDPGKRPYFQPGSMSPTLARTLVNIAGAAPGARILDPMCGTGGTLIEAALVGAQVTGNDVQWKMVRGCLENLQWAGVEGQVVRGTATRLPFSDGAFDGVVFDAPYGRQSKIVGELRPLVEQSLAEAGRVADRTVLVADRRWGDVAATVGWRVEGIYERRVHRSLTRYIHVLV